MPLVVKLIVRVWVFWLAGLEGRERKRTGAATRVAVSCPSCIYIAG
jgi:hypothetical protein